MNKILYLLITFFGLSTLVSGQDFKPGQQAQGMLESKNVTVDHTTGMFHYRIPLYTLKSGGYELPISLNYTASGVRTEDRPGITGYNWTLNCGGVVTRTVRGGIADETPTTGYLWQELYSTPLQDDFKKVNRHERDGESDIFTAVFNGQSVNFILTKDDDDKFHAEPLERTNVRIETEQLYNQITGWVITDESGNRYIYREAETTQNIYKEDANSFNGVRNNTPYNSSWYLTRIEPLNGGEIVFEYEDEPLKQTYSNRYRSKYEYGLPMVEYPFDFSKYKSQFNKAIQDANMWIQDSSNKISIDTPLYIFTETRTWLENPGAGVASSVIANNRRIMGTLASYTQLGSVSYDLYNELNSLISYYSSYGYPNSSYIINALQSAKTCISQYLTEAIYVTEKEVDNVTSYYTYTPLLSSISCEDKCIRFTYGPSYNKKLERIELYQHPDSLVSCYDLNIDSYLLKSISFSGKDLTTISTTCFDYYQLSMNTTAYTDLWGFKRPKVLSGEETFRENYVPWADDEYSKDLTLKGITLDGGDKIRLDYETNRVSTMDMGLPRNRYGGLRIKSIVLDNVSLDTADTISYSYPENGRLVHDYIYNDFDYSYRSGTDRIMTSRIQTKGTAMISTGNNGVYYPFVLEQINHKGTTAYWFHVPKRFPDAVSLDILYPFWLYGLPLATAQYDNNGNLLEMTKNYYLTDKSFNETEMRFIFPATTDAFIAADSLLQYRENIFQMQADEYYMDEDYLSLYYSTQGSISLGAGHSFSPYSKLYLPNIYPRTQGYARPTQNYHLRYGGKTLLKEQRMYKFSGTVTTEPDESDIDLTAQRTPYQKTVLHYDNLEHSLQPTRTETTDSKGDVYVQATQHVTETDAQDSTIARMQAANVLTPVIKQSRLKNGKLIEQNVFEYETENATDSTGIGLKNEYVYVPQSAVEYTPSYPEPVFSFAQSSYIPVRTYTNERVNGYYMPVQKEENGTTSAIVFDASAKGIYPLLQVSNGGTFKCMAIDTKPYVVTITPTIGINIAQQAEPAFNAIDAFWEKFQSMNFQNSPYGEVMAISSSERNLKVQEFIKMIVDRGENKDIYHADSLLYDIQTNNYIALFMKDYYDCCENGYLTPDNEYTTLLVEAGRYLLTFNLRFLEYVCHYNEYNILFFPHYLESAISDDHKRFVLHICSDEAEIPIEYQVVQNGVTVSDTLTFENSTGKLKIAHFKIDLSQYDAGAMLRIRIPIDRCHMYLVPEGYEFDATVYNDDYSVHARFNQSGEAEFYEYDPAGRVIRITDQNGHTRKEYEYHTVTNNE